MYFLHFYNGRPTVDQVGKMDVRGKTIYKTSACLYKKIRGVDACPEVTLFSRLPGWYSLSLCILCIQPLKFSSRPFKLNAILFIFVLFLQPEK